MDIETFLTTLYVIVDDCCKMQLPQKAVHPGPAASLSRSEVVTLAASIIQTNRLNEPDKSYATIRCRNLSIHNVEVAK